MNTIEEIAVAALDDAIKASGGRVSALFSGKALFSVLQSKGRIGVGNGIPGRTYFLLDLHVPITVDEGLSDYSFRVSIRSE